MSFQGEIQLLLETTAKKSHEHLLGKQALSAGVPCSLRGSTQKLVIFGGSAGRVTFKRKCV